MDIINTKNKILNKNFFLFLIVLILIIVMCVLFFVLKTSKKETAQLQTFSSSDEAISLSVYDDLGFSELKDDDYILSIRSAKIDASIFISKFSTNNVRDINKFIEADKNDYISKFSNINQVSDISEYTISNLHAYNCHFNYSENMYVDVYWILKDSNLYVIDFNINKEKRDLSSQISEILNSVKFN